MTLLQRDLFARINPAIVEAYLDRLSAAGVLAGRTHRGRLRVPPIIAMREQTLPASLGGGTDAHIATSGEALRAAEESIEIGNTVTLGPGEPAFTDLIALADHALAEDLNQSGAAADPST